jgi:hypothetical protein
MIERCANGGSPSSQGEGKIHKSSAPRFLPYGDTARCHNRTGAADAKFIQVAGLEHDPEKACPGLDPGWKPVFGKDHARTQYLDHDPIQLDRIVV